MRPTDIITVTRLGHTFRASRRTVAHLDYTAAKFHQRYPSATLKILQTCYHTGYAPSAHTHDFDACFDFDWNGYMPHRAGDPTYGWRVFQSALRALGWGGWWRHTGTWAPQSAWHFHGFSLPEGRARLALRRFATKVGEYIDGGWSLFGRQIASSQLVDYAKRAFGLAGQHTPGSDHSYYPPNLEATVFNYARFLSDHPTWKA